VDKGAWAFRPDANIEDYMTIEELLEEVIITIRLFLFSCSKF